MTPDPRVILITGASRGMGQALAEHFAKRGAMVVLTGRNEAGLEETAARIRDMGGRCAAYVSDLRIVSTLERMVREVGEAHGRVDVLINNAADGTSKPFLQTTHDEMDNLIRTNVIGALQLTRLVVPLMLEAGTGTIVTMSSLAGRRPNPAQTVYGISKAAVNSMSDGLRAELRGIGIHVLNVVLSSAATDFARDPGHVPALAAARRIEQAIVKRQDELVLWPENKWPMRLCRFCMPWARRR